MTNGPWGGPDQGPRGNNPQGGFQPGGGPRPGGPSGFPQGGGTPAYPPQGGQPGWPQQGGSPGYPPQGRSPGYPPQGGQQGWPQQGGSPTYPPQQGGQPPRPEGYAPPGYPQQPGPPYGAPQGPYPPGGQLPPAGGRVPPGPAPKRNLAPVVVAVVAVVLIALGGLAWFLAQGSRKPVAGVTASSTPISSASRAPSSAAATTASSKPATTTATKATTASGKAPVMPAEVGGLKAIGVPTELIGIYMSPDASKNAMAMALPGVSASDATRAMPNATTVRAWTCGLTTESQGLACVTQSPYGSALLIAGMDDDVTQLTTWGDEFVSKWK